MEKYENLGLVGEGSYGMVLKCKHKDSGQLVAIKKFLESEDDKMVKKIAMREVKMLKQLRHDHLVNLLEVFRRKKRLYLVFEYVDHTVLDELEKCPNGLDETTCRKILWQVLKGIEFCHMNNIIHRDIKPENILVSKNGVVKLCDFGFARTLAQPGEIYTDYVATRWYRAPELLVGDAKYGKAVDVWAVGCLLVEMLTGEPLFPGDSDIDQLYHIVKVFGNLTQRHKEVFLRNPLFVGMRLPEVREITPLEKKFSRITSYSLSLIKDCLQLDPDVRPTCSQLLKHDFFTRDGFAPKFAHDIKAKINKEQEKNALLNSIVHDDDEKNSADHGNNKTTTKKKKKVPLMRKVDTDHGKSISRTEANKPGSKEDSKASTEDKSKRLHGDPPDKGSKKTPPTTTVSHSVTLPPATNTSKTQAKPVTVTEETSRNDKTSSDKSNSQDKAEKSDNKSDKHRDHDKHEKHDKHVYEKVSKVHVGKVDKVEKSEKTSKSDRTSDDRDERETVKSEKLDKDRDTDSKSENKSDTPDKVIKGAEAIKNEHSKGDINRDSRMEKVDRAEKHEKGSDKHDRGSEKQDAEKDDSREKDVGASYKDSSSMIPPIHQSGHNVHTSSTITPTSIPAISSPNVIANSSPHIFAPPVNNMVTSSPRGITYAGPPPLRVNDKMVKKQQAAASGAFKKSGLAAGNSHHSVVLSPQPLQSEKSHLHDKSLEKLRTQKRESTILEGRRSDKEMISFPEVRGAEAAPVKAKSKAGQAGSRSTLATIPHITNLDPFPSSSQKPISKDKVQRTVHSLEAIELRLPLLIGLALLLLRWKLTVQKKQPPRATYPQFDDASLATKPSSGATVTTVQQQQQEMTSSHVTSQEGGSSEFQPYTGPAIAVIKF